MRHFPCLKQLKFQALPNKQLDATVEVCKKCKEEGSKSIFPESEEGFREEVTIEPIFGRGVGLTYICVALGILQNILVIGGTVRYSSSLFHATVEGQRSQSTGGRDLALYQPSWSDLPEVAKKTSLQTTLCSTPIIHMAPSLLSLRSLLKLPLLRDTSLSHKPKKPTPFTAGSLTLPCFILLSSSCHLTLYVALCFVSLPYKIMSNMTTRTFFALFNGSA